MLNYQLPHRAINFQVKIQVVDINDNRPLFDRNTFEKAILENVPDGSEIVKFTAKDLDEVSEKTKLILPPKKHFFNFFPNFLG